MLTTVAHCDWDSALGSHGCDSSALPLSYSAIPIWTYTYAYCIIL